MPKYECNIWFLATNRFDSDHVMPGLIPPTVKCRADPFISGWGGETGEGNWQKHLG